jgi:hypothetical protein
MMKQCTKCKEWKEEGEYSKNRSVKSGLKSECKMCESDRRRKYREVNPGKVNESVRKWRKANPEKVKEVNRKQYKANPEKEKEKCRRWRKANPERVKEVGRKYREANPEKEKEKCRRWRKANPEKVLMLNVKGNLKQRHSIQNAPEELIECKMIIIKTKRILKQQKTI